MSEWTSGDVIANGVRRHYYRTGGDKPPLVLAHGFTDSALCWTRFAQALERDYDIVMVDARGHGLSEASDGGYNCENQASDLAGVIEALGLGKSAIMGHSMGAFTAATTAARYPQLVRCAILEDPPWGVRYEDPASTSERAERAEQWRAHIVEAQTKTRDEIIAAGKAESPSWAEMEWIPWAKAKLQVDLKAFGLLDANWTPWQEIIEKITCPILLLYADAIVTPELAEEIASRWRTGKAVYAGKSGHDIRREQFEKTVETVTAFLKEA